MVLSERIIVGCNSKHSCSPHSQQVSGMNRGFLFEQLPLMGSSSFPETRLTARRTSLALPCLSNAACVSSLSQRSASPQGSGYDPHPLLCLFLINMDYLFGCGKDNSIENSRDHPTNELRDSQCGLLFQTLRWPFKPSLGHCYLHRHNPRVVLCYHHAETQSSPGWVKAESGQGRKVNKKAAVEQENGPMP